MMQRYIRVWRRMITNAVSVSLATKLGAGLFVMAKLMRFSFFLLTLLFLMHQTKVLAGYSQDQVLFVFLTYTLVDTIAQLFFREVYRFRPRVVSGDFDLDLLKPLPSLFRPLFGGLDIFDAITLIPYIFGAIVIGLRFSPDIFSIGLYLLLIFNAVLISASFHILVLSLGILTTEIDHTIMMYRDITSMGRFPIDIYTGTLRTTLLFVIPVGLMVTVPVWTLTTTYRGIFIPCAFAWAGILLAISLLIWRFSLRRYTSASS